MVIFHSYVKLPEGIQISPAWIEDWFIVGDWNMICFQKLGILFKIPIDEVIFFRGVG